MTEYGLQQGTPDVKSVGKLAFGPDDILFVADNVNATITALDVHDTTDGTDVGALELDDIDGRLASYLNCDRGDIDLRDMAVHPRTSNIFFSVMRGKGDDAVPVIVRLDPRSATMSEVSLHDVHFAQTTIDNAPAVDDERQDRQLGKPGEGEEREFGGMKLYIKRVPARQATVTDLAYTDGVLLVAGMSNEEFASNMRRIPFPFTGDKADANLEIFHVAHGKWETAAPIRTFVPTDGGAGILASYTCTPVVYFQPDDIASASKVTGRTVAELGNRNQPLDMILFKQGGEEYALIANSTRPMMKFKTSDAAAQDALTEPKEPVGIPRFTVDIPGVTKLANLSEEYVLALQTGDSGARNLRSLKTESI